jgi:hypothetical protein
MRRLFLIFMMVLLPLSSWAGNAMAINMIASKLVSQDDEMASSHCPNMVAMHETQPENDQQSAACTDCQACHLFAMQAVIFSTASTTQSPAVSQAEPDSFISTQLSPPIKPPIS